MVGLSRAGGRKYDSENVFLKKMSFDKTEKPCRLAIILLYIEGVTAKIQILKSYIFFVLYYVMTQYILYFNNEIYHKMLTHIY
jgi:hypothetical protein